MNVHGPKINQESDPMGLHGPGTSQELDLLVLHGLGFGLRTRLDGFSWIGLDIFEVFSFWQGLIFRVK
jgi:hypothetical protein